MIDMQSYDNLEKLVAERKRLYDEAIERENEQRTEINKMRRWLTVLCKKRRDSKREYEAALSDTDDRRSATGSAVE